MEYLGSALQIQFNRNKGVSVMETQTQAGKIVSYTYGIMIAAVVVLCLILTFYFTSDGFAAQQLKAESEAQQAELKTKSAAELAEIINPLSLGKRPGRGPQQDRVLAAILQLGEEENDLDQRIEGIATAGNISDTEYAAAAQIAIKKLGGVSLDRLKAMLESGDLEQVSQAVICVKMLGEDAGVLVPQLIELIESGDLQIARYGVFAIQNMGASAAPAVEAFGEVIHSLDFNAQIMISKAVIGIGRDAAPIADDLAEIYEKGNISARSWAGIALGAIGPIENFDTAKMLGDRVTAFNHVDKTRALAGLALMGDEGASQQEVIKAAMNDPKGRVRPQAAYAYYRVTDETETPVKTLLEMLPSRTYSSDALKFLRMMGPDAKAAIPAVRKLLNNDSVAIRESAVLVLGNMGAAASEEIANIRKLASDSDPLLRQAVEQAVAAIENDMAKEKAE